MSLFGKILAILNVFAVVGVLALMAMNYAKRLSWEYAVFRQDLMRNGLPLNDKETDALQQRVVDKIGPSTQQDLFKQASPNTPVATQEAEVDRVQKALTDQIQAAGDKKKQIAALARILAPMADTIEQRQRMLAYQMHLRDDKTFAALKARLLAAHKAATAPVQGRAKPYEERFHDTLAAAFSDPPGPLAEEFLAVRKADPKADFDKALEQSLDNPFTQLQGQFEQMFRNAKSGGEGAKPGAPSPQQKRAIARLLFNMVEVLSPPGGDAKPDLVNNPAYKRFVIVVGVQAAVEAVNERAGILQDLAFETQAERQRERNLFAEEHRKAVDLVRDKKVEVDQHKLLLDLKKKERETHEAKLEERRRDVKVYQEQLAAARRETAQHLEQLRKLSKQLFAERVMLRENSEDNQKLEKQIRALEEER